MEGDDFRLWKRQVIELNREAKRKKRLWGRHLGKSITASDEFKQACILWTKPTGVALFASPREANLEPIFRRELVDMFKRVPFLRLFLPGGDAGINFKTFEMRLLNGVTIRGRIEGSGQSGMNTVHPSIIAWVDEAQAMSDAAIADWYGMISGELPIIASGVPNGVRTSWAFRIDNDQQVYDFQGGKMTRLEDPRFTDEMNRELLDFYGGPQSSGYLNKVLGEWGADARMTFDMDRIVRDLPMKPDAISTVKPTFYRSLELHARDVANQDGTPRLDVLAMRFSFRGDMPRTDKIWFAADYGQSASPTTLYIHFWDMKEQCWRSYHRVLLYGMEAPTQAEIVHWLAQQIKGMTGIEPAIGFDATDGGGSSVVATLLRHGHPLVRVNVNEAVDTREKRLETDDEFKKRYAKDPFSPPTKQLVPIYQRWRQVAFPRLARELYAERLRLVNEASLVKQIAGTTDYESNRGNERKYETDYTEDGRPYNHDLSAFEILGAMLHELDVEHADMPQQAWAEPMPIAGWGMIESGYQDDE